MDRQRSAGYFEVRRTSALTERPLLAQKRTVGKARMRDGSRFKVDQTNNSYIFPGVGLGALAVGARRVSDGMFMAAAKALANSSQRPW
jgi:malic enzyme